MIASVPFDLQATDTYFIVGHIHYVLLGGAVAPLLGAFYYWFPKFTGRSLSEGLGRWNFWLYLIGVNLTFAPMLVLGLRGMTRRIFTYPADFGWSDLNLLSTLGGLVLAASFLLFLINVAIAYIRPPAAEPNPWHAAGLEWLPHRRRPPTTSRSCPWWRAGHRFGIARPKISLASPGFAWTARKCW